MVKYLKLSIILIMSMLLFSCVESAENTNEVKETTFTNNYIDSKDEAIVSKVNTINKTITFYNYELEKSYTLSYDGLTNFSDKYGTALSVKQIYEGAIVDIEFVKFSKRLVNLKETKDVFVEDNLTDFSVNLSQKLFTYKGDSYKITTGTILIAPDAINDLRDLDPVDQVTICGKDNEIYSLIVDKAHGYLELENFEHLLNGYVELSDGQMYKIVRGFYLVLPEGDYSILVTKNNETTKLTFEIKPCETTRLDLSVIQIEENKYGKVLFNVTPNTATVRVDGVLIDYEMLQSFEYGTHKVEASAEGYESFSKYFEVKSEKGSLDINLTKIEEEKTETETDSSNTAGRYVFIQEPSGVEVYYDGSYIGLAPVSFEKKAGEHTITIKKAGYADREYKVTISNTDKDEYFSFGELVKEEKEESSN